MAHLKLVQYGKTVEVFTYERPVPPRNKPRKPKKTRYPKPFKVARSRLNVNLLTKRFYRTVHATVEALGRPLMLTLTYADPEPKTLKQANPDLTRCMSALRRKFGTDFQYIVVPEFQLRRETRELAMGRHFPPHSGYVHYHCLIFGISTPLYRHILENERYYDYKERSLHNSSLPKSLTPFWPHGFYDIIHCDDSEYVARYLAKYMRKMFEDDRSSAEKAYFTSRGVVRPVSVQLPEGIDPLLILGEVIGVDNSPVHISQYDTKYRGACQHEIFKN